MPHTPRPASTPRSSHVDVDLVVRRPELLRPEVDLLVADPAPGALDRPCSRSTCRAASTAARSVTGAVKRTMIGMPTPTFCAVERRDGGLEHLARGHGGEEAGRARSTRPSASTAVAVEPVVPGDLERGRCEVQVRLVGRGLAAQRAALVVGHGDLGERAVGGGDRDRLAGRDVGGGGRRGEGDARPRAVGGASLTCLDRGLRPATGWCRGRGAARGEQQRGGGRHGDTGQRSSPARCIAAPPRSPSTPQTPPDARSAR